VSVLTYLMSLGQHYSLSSRVKASSTGSCW
jgi:hypothetical protein